MTQAIKLIDPKSIKCMPASELIAYVDDILKLCKIDDAQLSPPLSNDEVLYLARDAIDLEFDKANRSFYDIKIYNYLINIENGLRSVIPSVLQYGNSCASIAPTTYSQNYNGDKITFDDLVSFVTGQNLIGIELIKQGIRHAVIHGAELDNRLLRSWKSRVFPIGIVDGTNFDNMLRLIENNISGNVTLVKKHLKYDQLTIEYSIDFDRSKMRETIIRNTAYSISNDEQQCPTFNVSYMDSYLSSNSNTLISLIVNDFCKEISKKWTTQRSDPYQLFYKLTNQFSYIVHQIRHSEEKFISEVNKALKTSSDLLDANNDTLFDYTKSLDAESIQNFYIALNSGYRYCREIESQYDADFIEIYEKTVLIQTSKDDFEFYMVFDKSTAKLVEFRFSKAKYSYINRRNKSSIDLSDERTVLLHVREIIDEENVRALQSSRYVHGMDVPTFYAAVEHFAIKSQKYTPSDDAISKKLIPHFACAFETFCKENVRLNQVLSTMVRYMDY